jgi:hypothetical protein
VRGARRDPLSTAYDAYWRGIAIRAIRSGRTLRVWVASPSGEFRHPDPKGRTRHERAFTRSGYYLLWRAPINAGEIPAYSLKLTWGPDDERQPSGTGRIARWCNVRVFPRSSARVRGERWNTDANRSRLGEDGRRVIPA